MVFFRRSHDVAPAGEASADLRPPPDVARQQIRRFWLIAGIFVVLLLIALGASWLAIEVVNSTRAYATGEGRYSKAQKIAVISLRRYAYSGQQSDYAAFQAATAVPLGDHAGRLALEATPVDLHAAATGFLAGQNHPDDIAGLIWLFRSFSWWGPFAAAVADWRQGDRLVAELIDEGKRLERQVAAGALDADSRGAALDRIGGIDDRLTALENTFSTHMGEAARGATRLVGLGLGATTILLWAIGMRFAVRLFRQQIALGHQLGVSEQRFRDYAEVASDWYWELDAENRITYLSERFFDVTGAAPSDILGVAAVAFIHERAVNTEDRAKLDALATRRAFRGLRLRYRRDDGQAIYLSMSGKPHVDAAGRFQGYRGVGSDVTAAVNDATILREAKERAEIASRSKSEFLANMSHELRTPLNAILGFSEIITDLIFGTQAIERYVGYAGDIHASGRHLLSIIDDVLDLAKIEAGHAALDESEVALDELVGATRRLFAGRFELAGLTLAIELPKPAPRLWADGRKLKQSLANLLSNALKFTPRGGRVTIAAMPTGDGGFAIVVRDTGIGVAPDDIATVLAPFGQVESAFSRQHHGTGLGLPLAQSLIALHGGTLRLDSVVDVGTAVTLWLPAERLCAARPAVAV